MNNEDKNESNNNNNNYILKSFYLIKNNFPTSDLFYRILFSLKYIGLIINSRIVEMSLNNETLSLNKYLRNFLIFGKGFSPIYKNYQFITILGALFLFFFVLFGILGLIYMKIKYQKINSLFKEKMEKTNEKLENIFFKIISYINITIIFFHQYILEYYFFGIYGFIYYQMGLFSKNETSSSIYAEKINEELYDYFSNNNNSIIFVINLFVIIGMYSVLFIFLLFNTTKGLFLTHGMYCGNMKFLIMKLILLSFQPFFGLTNFYSDKSKVIVGLILNGVILILCTISFWSCLHQFGYYPNSISKISLYFEFFAYFSSLIEIIIWLTGAKTSEIFFLVKLFIELINSYFFLVLFIFLKDKHNLYIFAKTIFSKNFSIISKGCLYYYMRIYLEYQKDKSNNYLKLFRILSTHVKICKKFDCPGHKLIPINYLKSSFLPITIKDRKYFYKKQTYKRNKDIDENIEKGIENDDSDEEDILVKNNYFSNILENNDDNKDNKKIDKKNNGKDSIFSEDKKLNEKQFQIIFEQEIINKIEYLYKSKKNNLLEDFIFIHIQYLYAMKKNYSLVLYYIGKYSNCGIKWSFMTQYYLYEYKKLIISIFFSKTNINNVDKNANKYRKDNHLMMEIINYFIFSAILNNLVVNSCSKLKLLLNFRKDLHIPIFIKSYNRSKTEKFFEIGEELKNNIDKILLFLRHHLNEMNQQTISAELSYIISNFFIFIENKIPYDLRKIINPIFDINVISNKLESGYKFLNLVHPLILTLTKNNNFIISHFSSVICNRLGYFKYELKDKDFHDKLFPGVTFIKQHELLMKQFLFFDCNSYIKKDTFIKTKDGYLLGIKLTTKKFPTFYNDFFLSN